MLIEKDYKLVLDDFINFQEYYFNKNGRNNSSKMEIIIFFLPSLFLAFSLLFIDNNFIKIIGMIIIMLYYMWIVIKSINSKKVFKKYIENNYYKNFEPEHVTIKIEKDSISEYYKNFEQKIYKNWVIECVDTKDYLYLMNNKNYVIILPKKYFSSEEQEMIKNSYDGIKL
jgi:Ca2+/Na+ antiporter